MTDGPMATAPEAGQYGAFILPSPEPGWHLLLICDDGTNADVPESIDWEHVSARAIRGADKSRVPTWREMAFIKETFWEADDLVVQYHPPKSEYVNMHPHVLHLWRHRTQVFPRPPRGLV